jgi:hypothetical protein
MFSVQSLEDVEILLTELEDCPKLGTYWKEENQEQETMRESKIERIYSGSGTSWDA